MNETKEQLIERLVKDKKIFPEGRMLLEWQLEELYDAIAAHAIREDRLKLLGARPINCFACPHNYYFNCRTSEYRCRVNFHGGAVTLYELHASCPCPEATTT